MMMPFTGEGWGEGMSRMVIDDEMWPRLEELLRDMIKQPECTSLA